VSRGQQEGRRLLISGRVQGVGFRWFTRRAAVELGVTGWVRNLPSGDVEVQATGSPSALARLKQELERGPGGARVSSVGEEQIASVPEWEGFEVVF
jgi:acylphosphatase